MTRRSADPPAAAPIIVVSGLPRSGTSLMMSLLEAAGVPVLQDDARPADESNPRGYYELAAVKRTASDPGWVDGAAGRAVKVIHRLLDALPRDRRYRVILMQRPIAEVVASQDRMLARLGEASGGIPAERLSAVLEAQLAEAKTLLEQEDCVEWIAVDYPRLVADPESECDRVIDFLGLDASAAVLARRVDPALHRERG